MFKRILTTIYSISILWAVNASPERINVYQPDGSVIECMVKGDEWANWHETIDGYSITQNENQKWMYAEGVNGRFLSPGIKVVGQDDPPVFIPKHLTPLSPNRLIPTSNVSLNISRTDTFKIPVIYFQFPDQIATYGTNDFIQLYNQEGYGHPGHPGSGSFKDYYQEISYGQFLPSATLVGIFTAPHNHDYYGSSGTSYGVRVRQLIRAMVDSAEAAGIDWTPFDNDGDGDVDGLTLIHTGYGAEEGDGSNIWSHRWSMGNNAVTYDNILINDYNIFPELQGNNITAIGVMVHEFGHILGLPDLYDTDYSSSGAGKLALMASGSWGISGNTPWYPSSMNAWSKTELNWTNVIDISTEELNINLEQSFSSNTIYRINHPNDTSEYWLMENRQDRGTDQLIPQPGILIWHIDTEKTSGWHPNNDEPHYGVGLEQADGLFELENNGGSDWGDPYPGLTNNREFTHCSTPSTVSYYNEPSMVAITNISDPDSVMTFDISFNDIETGTMTGVGFGDAYTIGYLSISATNNTPIRNLSFELIQHPDILSIESIEVAGRATADSIIVTDHFIELVNPNIPAGNGEILILTVFAHTGSDGMVNLDGGNMTATDISGNMICLAFNESHYVVNPITQIVSIDTATGNAGGISTVAVNVKNNIPLKWFIMNINHSPDYLNPIDELYIDANQNGQYDSGEFFEDFNGNGRWSPMVETTDRTATWELSAQISDVGIIVGGVNSLDSIAIGEGPIFNINYLIDGNALSGNVNIMLTVVNLMDVFGNYNLQYESFNGVLVVTNLSTEDGTMIPDDFSMSTNYPNPFNPTTHLSFTVPIKANVSFRIYSILGKEVMSVQAEYEPGVYQLEWHGRDQQGNRVPSGIYILKMESGHFLKIQKLTLLK